MFASKPPTTSQPHRRTIDSLLFQFSGGDGERGSIGNPSSGNGSSSNTSFSPRRRNSEANDDSGAVNDAVAHAAFNEKKWVWVQDKQEGFIAGYVTKELSDDKVEVYLNNDTARVVSVSETEKMNPPKFDKVEDMADLTFLNEASVIHNLKQRYHSNLIYTYSGLFLVAVNPYQKLQIYTDAVVNSYKHKKRSEVPPHIYAVSDAAYRDMLLNRENQSILITGESGAGKTENTKKVIQYLASIAVADPKNASSSHKQQLGLLEQQILQANPILEAFGNAQTIRNNNSSRFGKFIRIEFDPIGHIVGANVERYLLEKSRVIKQTEHERNYHIFYQFLKAASHEVKEKFYLDNSSLEDYRFTKFSRKDIDGVDDVAEFNVLLNAMNIIGLTDEEQHDLFRVTAAVLHFGNIHVTSDRDEQAQILHTEVAEKVCNILGIPTADFLKGLLTPQVKAGREWVVQARTMQQVLYTIEALVKTLYDRNFGTLVNRINKAIGRPTQQKSMFIGVLDIAGFEIFEVNSFEQLCINYTNEKLQQFFNHHMFVLEQEEYRLENIDWKFIDFGMDLQPTIDLIEKANPVGILSCLDEECVVPKATDKTFIDKLDGLWRDHSPKYEPTRFQQGFILHHYAAKVEYRTTGWLDKNKDPLNENVTRLLAHSSVPYIASLFPEHTEDSPTPDRTTVRRRSTKKGFFRTVAQRHKEQLHSLMQQLDSTRPHFVRCIVPNNEKKPSKIHVPLVLDQLRCNGVLEGIRICRAGFPNRLPFSEFRQRYEILSPGIIANGLIDDREATIKLIDAFKLDESQYRIGNSKVFFRAGLLAELEEVRDAKLSHIFSRFQALIRGLLARKRFHQHANQAEAVRLIQKNVRAYLQLREWPWWKLYSKSKPLLNVTRMDEEIKQKDSTICQLENSLREEVENRQNLEQLVRKMKTERETFEEEVRLKNIGQLERTKKALQEELEELRARLETEIHAKQEEAAARRKIQAELQELQIKYDAETAKSSKFVESLNTYRSKADGTVSKLESVELEKLKAEKIEEYLNLNVKELEEALADATNDQKVAEDKVKSLEEEIMEMETKMDDEALVRRRLQEDLEEERERYKKDLEEQEFSLEQTRKKYQKEFARLVSEVEMERANVARLRQENKDLAMENNDFRSQTEEDMSGMSNWKRDKEKLEAKLADLAQLYNDAVNSQDELQMQNTSLVAQLRDSRVALDESESSKVSLEKLKRNLEERIEDIGEQYHSENQNKQAAERSISVLDTELSELRQLVEEQQETIARFTEKLRKSEIRASEAQAELVKEREDNQDLIRAKVALEKQIKELNLKVVDLETKTMTSPRGLKRLESRLEELTLQLEMETRDKNEALRQQRKSDRTIRELQYQLAEREKSKMRAEEDIGKYEQKTARMRQTIEELQTSESSLQLSKRRAEREANEARERSLRLEREMEKLKTRLDRTTLYTE